MSKRLFKFIKIFSQIADDVFNLKIIKKKYKFFENTSFPRIFGWNKNHYVNFIIFFRLTLQSKNYLLADIKF